MSLLVDRKLQVINDRYKDNKSVLTAQKDVESIRKRATYVGAGMTTVAFVGNELVRVTKRTRKYIPCA